MNPLKVWVLIGKSCGLAGWSWPGHSCCSLVSSAASQERAIALFTAQGDRRGQATARNNLAAVQFETGDYTKATDNLTRAMKL